MDVRRTGAVTAARAKPTPPEAPMPARSLLRLLLALAVMSLPGCLVVTCGG